MLSWLKNQHLCDPKNTGDREMLAYILIPVIQREIDVFKDVVWNTHRIRHQKDTELPSGIPNHIFSFPEEYGIQNCGMIVTENRLREAAECSGVLDVEDDFLSSETREQFDLVFPTPNNLKNEEWIDTYRQLKQNIT